jgi:hypothetical protein
MCFAASTLHKFESLNVVIRILLFSGILQSKQDNSNNNNTGIQQRQDQSICLGIPQPFLGHIQTQV